MKIIQLFYCLIAKLLILLGMLFYLFLCISLTSGYCVPYLHHQETKQGTKKMIKLLATHNKMVRKTNSKEFTNTLNNRLNRARGMLLSGLISESEACLYVRNGK